MSDLIFLRPPTFKTTMFICYHNQFFWLLIFNNQCIFVKLKIRSFTPQSLNPFKISADSDKIGKICKFLFDALTHGNYSTRPLNTASFYNFRKQLIYVIPKHQFKSLAFAKTQPYLMHEVCQGHAYVPNLLINNQSIWAYFHHHHAYSEPHTCISRVSI